MLRPLLIEFDYKVTNNASGQIVRAFWESLDPKEFQPTIICKKVDNDFHGKWKLIEVPLNEDLMKVSYALKKFGSKDIVQQPDAYYFLWAGKALREVKKLLKTEKFDYIHSISCPYSMHLIAMEVKKMTCLPWIAQFHDPWIDSATKFNFSFFRNRFNKMESDIVDNADYIIHTNDVIVDIWKKRYGNRVSNKIEAQPLSFNVSILPERKQISHDKFIISHIGEIYGSRSLKDVVDALQEIIKENPSVINKVIFKLIGRVSEKERNYINLSGLESMFDFVGLLKPEQLTPYYQESDAFLALDMNRKNAPCFPSKLMMYYYYQKPILGITTSGSIMEQEMEESGNYLCMYGNIGQIKENLLSLMHSTRKCVAHSDYWRKFTVENVRDLYMKAVNCITT